MLKAVGPTIGKILLVLFGCSVFGLMIVLTFGSLGRIFPNDLLKQATGLILFDVGAFAWLVIFAYASRGAMQRSIALLLFIFCVAGAVMMAGADAMMSGQNFVEIPQWLGEAVVYVFIAATAVNLGAVYAHHLNSPDLTTQIRMQAQEDRLIQLALDKADAELEKSSHELAERISERYTHSALVSLNLDRRPPMVIDAIAKNVPIITPPPADIPADNVSGTTINPTKPAKRG